MSKSVEKENTESDECLSNVPERTETGSLKGVGGRPPGAKNKTTLFKEAMRDGFEKKLMQDGQKVFDACVAKALEGDTTAMKLIMDRVLPVADVSQGKGTGSGNIVINVQGMGANIEVMDKDDTVDAEYEEI